MAKVKAKNTKPEMKVRRALHAAGYRYRLHVKTLPGKPDLVLRKYGMVVFVHGCFWHWHGCKRSRMPSTNVEYWTKKINRNVQRGAEVQRQLIELGWKVVTIWECSIEDGIAVALETLQLVKPV